MLKLYKSFFILVYNLTLYLPTKRRFKRCVRGCTIIDGHQVCLDYPKLNRETVKQYIYGDACASIKR